MKILLTEKGCFITHNIFTLSSLLFLLEGEESIVYITSNILIMASPRIELGRRPRQGRGLPLAYEAALIQKANLNTI